MLPYRRPLRSIVLMAISSRLALAQEIPLPPGSTSSASRPVDIPNMSCGSVYSPQWDNCVGVVTDPNGNVYQGEYHHGKREGFGVITINARGVSDDHSILANEPSIYAGEFLGDRLNGHGIWFTASGAGYSGTYVNNIPQSDVTQKNCTGRRSRDWTNCVAKILHPNGNIFRGEFVLGLREGIGLLEIHATGASDAHQVRTLSPGVYVGEFRRDHLNGRGVIATPSASYYGTFTENILTGVAPPATQRHRMQLPASIAPPLNRAESPPNR